MVLIRGAGAALDLRDWVALAGLTLLALSAGKLVVLWAGVGLFGGGLFYLAHTMRGE